jgi:flagellar export protein FliJ
MKFNFSLNPVLKVRKHEEIIQKQKLAKEVKKKNQINQLQSEVTEKLNGYLKESNTNNAASIHDIKLHSLYLQDVHTTMRNLKNDESNVQKAIEEQRQNLEKVHKKRHILDKMEEFELDTFNENVERVEQKTLDEIAIQSFNR